MSRARESGFTLLEVLISIVITAILVAAVVQAYRQIHQAQERAAFGLDRQRAANVFLDRVERELHGTLLIAKEDGADPLAHPYLFVGLDGYDWEADTDALKFVTYTPARAASARVDPGVRMVTYGAGEFDEGHISVRRYEEPLPPGMHKDVVLDEKSDMVLEDVEQFGLRFRHPASGEWTDEWDSTDLAWLDELPIEVEITLALLEEDLAGEPVSGREYRRTVTLSIRPVDVAELRRKALGLDDPNQAPQEDGEAEACITISQCVDQFAQLIEFATPNEKAQIQEAVAVSGEECFDATGPLGNVLAEFGNPEVQCR